MSESKTYLDIDELKKFDDRLSNLSNNYELQAKDLIHRVGDFIIKRVTVLPKADVFAKWIFENRYIADNQDITEEDLYECAKIYFSELEERLSNSNGVDLQLLRSKEKFQSKSTLSLNWIGDDDDLLIIFNFLNPNFIDKKSDFNVFKNIFSDNILQLNTPIRWTESNRLIVYFFEMLYKNGLITNSRYQSVIEKFNLLINRSGKKIQSRDLSSAKNAAQLSASGTKKADKLNILIAMLKH